VAVAAPTVAVAVTTAGFADAESRALAGKVTAEVGAAGAVPVGLRAGAVATAACLADPACARSLLAGGEAPLLVAVDVLRAGSRAAVTARVIDTSGTLVADSATVISVAKLLGGSAAMLTPAITATLHPTAPTTAASPMTSPPPPRPPAKTPTTTTTPTPPPPPPALAVAHPAVVQPPSAAPAAGPAATAATAATRDEALTTNAVLGVGAAAAGSLFLLGGTAAALGQNAVRLDGGADGDDRAATALTIPLAMGVAVLGLAGVGVGAMLLMTGSDDVAPPPTAP
jgi:hypothetical protein